MENLPNCPECNSAYTYEDGALIVCPECGHEWTKEAQEEAEAAAVVKDVNGNILENGDTITIIKDLKVKGGSSPLKMGTRVKNISILEDPVNGHDLQGKVDGMGVMYIRSIYVKKI